MQDYGFGTPSPLRPDSSFNLDLWAGIAGDDGVESFRREEIDGFFEKCFPWLSEDSPDLDILHNDSQSASEEHALGSHGKDPLPHSTSSASESTSELRISNQTITDTGTPTRGSFDLTPSAAAAAAAAAAIRAAFPSAAAILPQATTGAPVVAGSMSSWISWGPPKQPEPPAALPHASASAPVDLLARASASDPAVDLPGSSGLDRLAVKAEPVLLPPSVMIPGMPDIPIACEVPEELEAAEPPRMLGVLKDMRVRSAAPARREAGQTAAECLTFQAASASQSPFMSVPPALGYPGQQQGQQRVESSPTPLPSSLTQLLYDDSLLEQAGRMASSSGSWGRKSSSGVTGGGAAAAAAAAAAASSRGPAKAGGGKAIRKDTTRRKNAEIARLELELKEKMSLAADLEQQRQELQRKERLLKLQVSTGERHLFCRSVKGITPHMVSLIQGFKSSFNQMVGGDLLAQMSKDPKEFGIKDFMAAWQSFVHEVAEDMLVDPRCRTAESNAGCERIANWCMSISIYAPMVIPKALHTNMQTGEEMVPSMEFWDGLMQKLNLSDEQVKDMRSVYSLYSSLLQKMTAEVTGLMKALASVVDHDIKQGNIMSQMSAWCLSVETFETRENLFKKLEVCERQCDMLETMLAFLVLSILTPTQQGLMVFHAFPSFPNLKLMLVAACKIGAPTWQP